MTKTVARVRDRLLNGFGVTIRGLFFWLNAWGIGVGKIDGPQFIVYRFGRKIRRG